MTSKQPKQGGRKAPARSNDDRRRSPRNTSRRSGDAPPRRRPAREQRPLNSAPQTNPIPRPTDAPNRPKSASQAKARAKARKAKAPKVVRPPLRERLRERVVVRLTSIELSPRALIAKVPFVVLVIGSLGVGLGTTLWLSTDAAERSYQLGSARQTNEALLQQKEALERDVQKAQAAPALAEAARDLGMIPSRDTAHLVQDPAGNWIVVGTPKPAEGVPPPPLNTPLPEEAPPAPPPPPAPRVVEPRELSVRLPSRPVPAPPPGAPGILGAPTVPGAPTTPAAPAMPMTAVPGAEVPHAVSGQTPALGPAPVAPPVVPLQAQTQPAPVTVPTPGAPA
jgi:cell division protein FtsB